MIPVLETVRPEPIASCATRLAPGAATVPTYSAAGSRPPSRPGPPSAPTARPVVPPADDHPSRRRGLPGPARRRVPHQRPRQTNEHSPPATTGCDATRDVVAAADPRRNGDRARSEALRRSELRSTLVSHRVNPDIADALRGSARQTTPNLGCRTQGSWRYGACSSSCTGN